MTGEELKELLDTEAARINSPEFVLADPVQFPRRYQEVSDIEIAALLCSSIAWGNRKMICRDCERMMSMMGQQPYHYMMEEEWRELPEDLNLHRTFFSRNLKNFMAGLKPLYERHGSLQGFARWLKIEDAWDLAEGLVKNVTDSRCLPQNVGQTALKRVNMALRWLVRNDGIVDIGCWDVLKPSQLYIPLDVHVIETSRELGLLTRRTADKKAAVELTGILRQFRPDDPCVYDFALFGIGMGL